MADVTIYTLAKELHMTPSMVSRAFNPEARISEEKRKIVLAAAEKHGFTPNKFASRLSMKPVRIGVLINSRFEVNTDKMVAGIKEAHAALKDYKIQYEIICLNPSFNTDEDVRKAFAACKDYDGIILTGMSSADDTALINDLYQANPNVVQVQAINQEANHLFASKHNEQTASAMAAEFLSDCLQKSARKNILLFTGELKSALHKSASLAFKDACDALSLNLLKTLDMKDDEEYFETLLPEVFARYADEIDGIYTTSGLSLPLCRYLEKNGISLPFVAFDTYEEIKQFMKKGVITAAVSQNVSHQMKTAFDLLVRHLITGEDCPRTVYTDIQLMFKSNMYQFD